MAQRWEVAHGRDGYALLLVEEPALAQAAENALCELDYRLGHFICEPPEWAFQVPLRLPKSQHKGKQAGQANTLGDSWWRVGQRLLTPFQKRAKRLATIPIPRDQALTLDPQLVAMIDDMYQNEPQPNPSPQYSANA